jgi:hypothetical protein
MPEGLTVERYEQAEVDMQHRVGRRGFAVHALLYVVTVAALTTINLVGNTDVIWFPFVLVGWGIGVLIHYLTGVRWSGADIRRHQKAVEKHALGDAG